jgi:hypothetical protein
MRTTAEPQNTAATAARETAAGRRARGARRPQSAAIPSVAEPPALAVTAVRLLRIDEGIHALRIGEIAGDPGAVGGVAVPMAQLSVPFAEDGNGVEIVAAFPRRGPWIGRDGGTAILRSPRGGGVVIVTIYGTPAQQQAAEPVLDLRRLDGPVPPSDQLSAPQVAGTRPAVAGPEDREIPTEILLHIERAGDRLFPGRGWVGALGRRVRIEAFSIRPVERLQPAEIEMKGFLPSGGETPWVPGGALCGTRGRGLPLTGFALRVVPQQADRYDVLYQGSFFAGGISELHRNGDPCRAAMADDPLEAINVRLVERGAETAAESAG